MQKNAFCLNPWKYATYANKKGHFAQTPENRALMQNGRKTL
jgi:hypothetical protein